MSGKTLAVIPLATVDERLVTVSVQDGAVDGVAKIVQAAVMLIATESGSIRHLPKLGANPTKRLRQISVADASQIQEILSEAASTVYNQLLMLFPTDTSDSTEVINSVVIEFQDYDPVSRAIMAKMTLDTAFGETADYPVTFSHSI